MTGEKGAIREFWDTASCGEVYAEGPTLGDQFRSHAEARYRLEPYIRPFARFDGRGRCVLEVGVGMGADHLEWAKSRPDQLVGIDLTPRAVDWTAKRLECEGFNSQTFVGDAENLDFPDNSFDIVYSWGVLHHTPDTARAFREVHRVLRPGGEARVMIYHRPSWVGLMLWAQYALFAGRPLTRLTTLYSRHLESPGTKGYRVGEARQLVRHFRTSDIRAQVSFGDLLEGEAGQRHGGRALDFARRLWPRPLVRRIDALGLALLIRAIK